MDQYSDKNHILLQTCDQMTRACGGHKSEPRWHNDKWPQSATKKVDKQNTVVKRTDLYVHSFLDTTQYYYLLKVITIGEFRSDTQKPATYEFFTQK